MVYFTFLTFSYEQFPFNFFIVFFSTFTHQVGKDVMVVLQVSLLSCNLKRQNPIIKLSADDIFLMLVILVMKSIHHTFINLICS